MGPIVFTLASLIWMALQLISTFIMAVTLNSAKWIISPKPYQKLIQDGTDGASRYPSLGIDTRCVMIGGQENCASFAVEGLSTDPTIFPTLWKISFIFFTVGLYIAVLCTIISLATCYFQSIYNKSLYNIVGCIQAVTGLFFLLAVIFYMAGWGNYRVLKLCGQDAAPFTVGDCSLGSSYFYAVLGVIMMFVCACISVLVERSTCNYRVNKRIHAGHKIICLF